MCKLVGKKELTVDFGWDIKTLRHERTIIIFYMTSETFCSHYFKNKNIRKGNTTCWGRSSLNVTHARANFSFRGTYSWWVDPLWGQDFGNFGGRRRIKRKGGELSTAQSSKSNPDKQVLAVYGCVVFAATGRYRSDSCCGQTRTFHLNYGGKGHAARGPEESSFLGTILKADGLQVGCQVLSQGKWFL